jgi:cell division protein FtsL
MNGAAPHVDLDARRPVQSETAGQAKRITPREVVLFCAAIAVSMFVVYSQMELSQLSRANQRAATELQALIREERILLQRVEAGVSLRDVEEFAIGELGMAKPTREQFVYVGTLSKDRAEIVIQPGMFGNIRNLFSSAGARVAEFLE